jgi:hypothetical protein
MDLSRFSFLPLVSVTMLLNRENEDRPVLSFNEEAFPLLSPCNAEQTEIDSYSQDYTTDVFHF